MFCTKCGFQLNEGDEQCPNCGNKIKDSKEKSVKSEIESKEPTIEEKTSENKTNKYVEGMKEKKVIIIAIAAAVVFVLLLGIGGYSIFFRSTPEKTIENFVEAIKEGDYREGLEKYTNIKEMFGDDDMLDVFMDQTLDKEFSLSPSELREMKRLKVNVVSTEKVTKDTCICNVKVYLNGVFDDDEIILKKVKGKWLIDIDDLY